ncbi:MAG: hypothetical protein M3N13_03945 [Candidatus Eremiobacteraeota bacterium]|nr:hypothetical protein [Candidatus Eremiobacteraeota bacterium]
MARIPAPIFPTIFAICLFAGALPAQAGPDSPLAGAVVQGANAAIKNVESAASAAHAPEGSLAQVPPVKQPPVGGSAQLGLPTGFDYTFDLSVAYPYGNLGTYGKKWLPGGLDAVASYGFNPTTRFVANYYGLQHYPVGFNSGTVPFGIQGLPNTQPVDLAKISPQIDVTTKDRFTLLILEKLFTIKMRNGRVLPIVISPTYVSRTSKIAASKGSGDVVPFEYNGFPIFGVHTRTAQVYSLAVTLPFLKTPKLFGTFTVAPTWLVHRAGLNVENKAQLYQILYLEYTPTDRLKFFIEPQSSRDYLPADRYAQHIAAYFLGVAQRVGRAGFVQLLLNSGSPTNYSPYGVTGLTCQQVGNCAATAVPTVGALKATQLQIQFGIGSPSVIQF